MPHRLALSTGRSSSKLAPLWLLGSLALACGANPSDDAGAAGGTPGSGATGGDIGAGGGVAAGAGGLTGDAGASGFGGSAGASSGGAGGAAGAGSTGGVTGAGGAGGGAGASPKEDCSKYPFSAATLLSERLGFGAGTTGGDPTKPYHVTTLADSGAGSLRAALESSEPHWVVFDVNGTITLGTSVKIKSNKTVDGRGRAITIKGQLRIEPGTENVILSDVSATSPSDGDVISLRGVAGATAAQYATKRFWFHHLDLFKGFDGLIDVRGATDITVSWGHFHSHAKAFLNARDTNNAPSPGMRMTYHHNYLNRITRRGPQFHYGLCDFFNNYQYEWYEFGATSQYQAQFLSEANIYQARPGSVCLPACPDPNSPTGDSDFSVSKKGLISGWDSEKGFIRSVGDLTLNEATVEQVDPQKVFSRSTYYAASPEPAGATLKAAIVAGAGPRTKYCASP
ncbi:MAG: hypothetical protein HYZ29_07005 [Myxococcales bacterium]|nr:hypothetical protein [Myxococcales bacterium]